MAIITKGGTPSKGSATSFTLNITDLLAHASVSGDAYFSVQSNWSKVFLNYISSIGGQKEFVIFKAVDSGTSDVADFSVFNNSRDVFEIDSVVILDKQGGTLKIPRASLNEADFDVDFSIISSNGTLDTAFMANAVDNNKFPSGQFPFAGAELGDGKSIVVGNFNGYGGQSGRNKVIKFNADGTVDTTFMTTAVDGSKFNTSVRAALKLADGDILIGGGFSGYAGTSGRNFLVKLSESGIVDSAFMANAVDGSKFPSAGGDIRNIVQQPDGKILICGTFANYGGTSGRNNFIRLNADGTLDTSFCINATDGSKFNSQVRKCAVQSDGKIIVVGAFTNYAGTTNRNRVIRLNADGTLDTSFCTTAVDGNKFNNAVFDVTITNDGGSLIVGSFTSYYTGAPSQYSYLVKLNNDGTINTTFSENVKNKTNSSINTVLELVDGKVLVGGGFTNYGGDSNIDYAVALNSDGSINTETTSNAFSGKTNGTVEDLFGSTEFYMVVFAPYPGAVNRNYLAKFTTV